MAALAGRCLREGLCLVTRVTRRPAVSLGGHSWRALASLHRPSAGCLLTSGDSTPFAIGSSLGGVRYAHTSGDKELVEFLKDEIKQEKEAGGEGKAKLPKLKGFELTSSDGPNVVLTRKADNETVVIKLNVNNSVDESIGEEAEGGQDEAKNPQMVCKPAFVVEITKGSSKTLAIQCIFPPEDDLPPPEHNQDEQQYEDLIEIQEVTLLDGGKEWDDDVYTLAGAQMDANLYDMLLRLLEERGVNGELIHQLVDFSTAYEHKRYVGLLEQLRDFATAK